MRFRVLKVGLMFGESLVNGFVTLRIVVIEEDGLYSEVDVGNICLLYNRLWCPFPWDESDYLEVVADERSSARWAEKEIAPGVIRTESKVDCNAGLGCMMEVDRSFRSE